MSAKVLTIALLLLMFFSYGCAGPMTAERLERRAGHKLNSLNSYYAEHIAVVYGRETEQTYQIKEWYQAPDLWRAEIAGTYTEQVFISDGRHIYIYEPGFDDYYRINMEQAPALAPPFSLSRYLEQFLSASERSFLGEENLGGSQFYKAAFLPGTPGDKVILWLDKKDFFPRRMETYNHGELISLIQTVKLDLTPQPQPGLFQFEAAGGRAAAHHCLIRKLSQEEMAEKAHPLFAPDYIPEGSFLYLVSHGIENGLEQYTFVYKGSRHFSLVQRLTAGTPLFVGESTKKVLIGRVTAHFQQNTAADLITLWWSKENRDFILTGGLSLREMVRIAASVQASGRISISGAYEYDRPGRE